MGGDHVGGEGSVRLLENNGDDVVAYVSFPLELLRISFRVGQQSRHVEHDLSLLENVVHGLITRVPVPNVQAAPVTCKDKI